MANVTSDLEVWSIRTNFLREGEGKLNVTGCWRYSGMITTQNARDWGSIPRWGAKLLIHIDSYTLEVRKYLDLILPNLPDLAELLFSKIFCWHLSPTKFYAIDHRETFNF